MSETGKQILKVGNSLKFTLTIESNNLGEIVDLFDFSRIHQNNPAPSFTPETPESLMEGMELEPEEEQAKPEITFEMLKHKAVEVSERLKSKKPVGEAIKARFNCPLTAIDPKDYSEAFQILEDLNNA